MMTPCVSEGGVLPVAYKVGSYNEMFAKRNSMMSKFTSLTPKVK